jgi:hypothetical protein
VFAKAPLNSVSTIAERASQAILSNSLQQISPVYKDSFAGIQATKYEQLKGRNGQMRQDRGQRGSATFAEHLYPSQTSKNYEYSDG